MTNISWKQLPILPERARHKLRIVDPKRNYDGPIPADEIGNFSSTAEASILSGEVAMFTVIEQDSTRGFIERRFRTKLYLLYPDFPLPNELEMVLVPRKTDFFKWLCTIYPTEMGHYFEADEAAAVLLLGHGLVDDGSEAVEEYDTEFDAFCASLRVTRGGGDDVSGNDIKKPRISSFDVVPADDARASQSCHGGLSCGRTHNQPCRLFHEVSMKLYNPDVHTQQ